MKGIRVVSFSLLFILIMTFSSCRVKEVAEGDKNAKTEVEKRITVWTSSSDYDGINNSAKRYSEKHSDVKLEILNIPETEIYEKINRSMYSGVEIPNAVLIDKGFVNSLTKRFPSSFQDLAAEFGEIKDKIVKTQINAVTSDNKIMGIPWDTKPYVMFYRRDIFENNGIVIQDIKTWNEYLEAGKKILNKTDGKVKMLSLDLEQSDKFLRLILNQLGEGYCIRESKKNSLRANYSKALSLIKNINSAGIAKDLIQGDKLIEEINGDNLATVLATPDFISTLEEKCKDLSGKWEIMTLPAFEAGGRTAAHISGSVFMITTINEGNKETADFIKYLFNDRENASYTVVKDNVYPPIEEVYRERWINEKSEYFSNNKIWRLTSNSALEIDDQYYPADSADIEKKVIDIQKELLSEGGEVRASVDRLLNEMPFLKEK
jgi:lactose/L-arabinose transport system substrate-binding protein